MILSDNIHPEPIVFNRLMKQLDVCLNSDARKREEYYMGRSGLKLEHDVYEALIDCAIGTPFQGSIQLISGASFPDIVVGNRYGVEVKSTEKNKWTSTGSSILESTRNQDVKRIYMTFGKLGKPVEFLSKPYEDCLSGIAVTHYPRYLIDMRLKQGETIFDKMNIPYDELRQMEEPALAVAEYYRKRMGEGEQLWWTGTDTNIVPPTIKAWSILPPEEKARLTAQGFVLFPEVVGGASSTKYNRFSLWLATKIGVVNPNARDAFSAGGKVKMTGSNGAEYMVPAVFGKIESHKYLIEQALHETDSETLSNYWQDEVDDTYEERLKQWGFLIADSANSTVGFAQAQNILSRIFALSARVIPFPKHPIGLSSTEYSSKLKYAETNMTTQYDPLVTETAEDQDIKPHKPTPQIGVGDIVFHQKYGSGKVSCIDVTAQTIDVLFNIGSKTFKYPDAFFDGYLESL